MELFRTEKKGWGVQSWDVIKQGEFVAEFTGQGAAVQFCGLSKYYISNL